jgi:hypothetical protein
MQMVRAPIVPTPRVEYQSHVEDRRSVAAVSVAIEISNVTMSRVFDLTEISEGKRHFYFYTLLILATLATATVFNHLKAPQKIECKRANQEVWRLMDMGAAAKDLY